MTSYDRNPESIEDPEIGKLVFYYKSWDSNDPDGDLSFTEIPSEPCFDNAFNDEDRFYPINQKNERDFEIYGQKMLCPIKPIDLFGNFDSDASQNLMVAFVTCEPSETQTCKTQDEIEQWLKFKYIVVLENEKRFITHKFDEERIEQSSNLKWFPISQRNRIDYVKTLSRTDMQIDDSALNIGSLKTESDTGFYFDRIPSRELNYENSIHNSITYELSLDKLVYYRRVYSVLDLLGDMGGLLSALGLLCQFLVNVSQYRGSYMFL